MIRISVIGAGAMGSNHARVISTFPGVELVGLFDQNSERCAAQALRFSTRSLRSIEESLDISDAVVIATPTSSHADIMKNCITAGKHVLVEKPVCESSHELLELNGMLTASIVMVGHVERFNPAVRFARTLGISKIHAIAARREGPYVPRISEGVTRDLMIHDIDLCSFLSGETLKVVGAGRRTALSATEDVSSAILESTSGFVASLNASRIGQSKIRDFRLTLEDRLVHLDLLQRTVVIYTQSSAMFTDSRTPLYSETLTTQTPIISGYSEPLAGEMECFVESILQGELRGDAASLEDGIRALDLANQIAAS